MRVESHSALRAPARPRSWEGPPPAPPGRRWRRPCSPGQEPSAGAALCARLWATCLTSLAPAEQWGRNVHGRGRTPTPLPTCSPLLQGGVCSAFSRVQGGKALGPLDILGAWLGHILSHGPHRGQGTPNRVLPGGLITRGTGYGVSPGGSAGPRTVTAPRYRGQGERAEWEEGCRGQKPLLQGSGHRQSDRASRGPPDRSPPLLVSCRVPLWLKPARGQRTGEPLMGCPGAAPRQGAAESFAFLCLVTFLPRSSVGMLCRRRDPGRAGVGRFSGTGFSEAGTLHEHVELRPAQRSSRAPPPHPPTEVWGRSGGFGLIPSSKVCICSEASVKDDLNSFTASLHKSECARWKTLCVNPFGKIHLHVELGFGGDQGSNVSALPAPARPSPALPRAPGQAGGGGGVYVAVRSGLASQRAVLVRWAQKGGRRLSTGMGCFPKP